MSTQDEKYKEALEESEKKEQDELTLDEIEAKAILLFDKYYIPDKDTIDVDLLAIILKRELKIPLGHNKLYRLKRQIEYDYPHYLDTPPIPIEK